MPASDHKILIDCPAQEPALGYMDYGTALADIINSSVPQFAVGIFGGWGSGKTTLMQVVRNKINPNDAICVEFSAWRYEKEDHLIIPLLATIKDAIEDWATNQNNKFAEAASRIARTIGAVVASLVAGINMKIGIPKVIELSFDASKTLDKAAKETAANVKPEELELTSLYYACFKALYGEFGRFLGRDTHRRIVVFVDDLDRCLPKGVLQVLESMKLFFDLYGFVFVVGLDQQVVEWCIDVAYAQDNSRQDSYRGYQVRGSDYIKKIFQVPFTLFPVSITQIDDFLNTLIIENELCDSQANEIREFVRPHLSYVVGDAGVNPREIKRFINAYTLNMKVKPNLKRKAVLALWTIRFRPDWQPVQEALLVYGDVFLATLKRQVEGEGTALTSLHRDFDNIPGSFLRYVSPGAPGNDLLSALPVEEYIRSGAATSSSGDPKILALIRDIGKSRITLDNATTEDDLEEVMRYIINLIKGAEPRLFRGERRTPFVDTVRRTFEAMEVELRRGPLLFQDSDKLAQWRQDVDACLSSAISALVQLFQSGFRTG